MKVWHYLNDQVRASKGKIDPGLLKKETEAGIVLGFCLTLATIIFFVSIVIYGLGG